MRYLIHSLNPRLEPYVEKIYILEHEGYLTAPAELSSPANPYSAMVLNYGDRYRLHSDFSAGTMLPASFLCGFSSRACRLELTGRMGMLGVVFRGIGLRSFFASVALNELTDQRHDLSAIIGADADRLCRQLADAPTNAARFALIEAYLLKRLRLINRTPTTADLAAHFMLNQRGMLSMDSLADAICVSPRHLRRLFTEQAGISPKFFARLKRFNYVYFILTRDAKAGWPDFLTTGGFYDQSHLIRDFVEFTGKAPSVAVQRFRKTIELVTE
ncbi:MAG: helix-turn-helix domain-containing protein [Rudanella sp.]|nr:helix-turn-helix domain-containing protein [Rudanella sp.]